jgi:acyl carrier protein
VIRSGVQFRSKAGKSSNINRCLAELKPDEKSQRLLAHQPEELVAEIWADVLKLDKAGIHDNFFDLGGHSLKTTQIVSRLREALQVDLPRRAVFEAPTVAETAKRIEHSGWARDEVETLADNLAEVEALSDEEIERQIKDNS